MIFLYSSIIKNKLNKLYNLKKLNKYDNNTYNYYYKLGLEQIIPILKEYADTINETFLEKLIYQDDIDIMFYSSNTEFALKNCQGIIIWTKTLNSSKEEKIYLLLLCIQKYYRKYGYGTVFLQEFIEFIKIQNTKSKRIILHSIETSVNFYKSVGFTEVPDKPSNYKKLFKFEKYNKKALLLNLQL